MPELQSQNWLQQWGTLAIAFIALIQPWVLFFYRKFFKRPVVEVFEAGNIEIGYSAFGPTVGLNGTLKVDNKDVFIRGIEVEVVRLHDHSTHHYEWSLFRSNKVRLSQLSDMEFELAAGFVLSPSQPHRYNILFVESKAQQDLLTDLQPFTKEWNDFLLQRLSEEVKKFPNVLPADQLRLAIYEEFFQTKIHSDTFAKLERSRYWDPGEYSITMTVNTSSPNETYPSSWTFSIDEANATMLSYNTLEILRTVCGSGTGIWNFANCQYKKVVPSAHNSTNDDVQT